MSSRRGIWSALALCFIGSLLSLAAGGRGWVTFPLQHALTIQAPELRQTGQHVLPGAVALGWVGLAGALAMVAVRGWARAAVGALLVVVGLAVAGLDLGWAISASAKSLVDGRSTAGHKHVGWPILSALGGLLVVASGGLAVARGRSWAGMGSSYEAPGASKEAPVTDKGVWDAFDRGDDPTA